MALQIKCRGAGALTAGSLDLYTVPANKAAIVKKIPLLNKVSGAVAVTEPKVVISVGSVTAKLLPPSMNINGSTLFVDDQELTLAAGEKISGYPAAATSTDYVISRVEREA